MKHDRLAQCLALSEILLGHMTVAGISEVELAAQSRVCASFINRILHPRRQKHLKLPSPEVLDRFVSVLGCERESLFLAAGYSLVATLGSTIRTARKLKGLTQEVLAEQSGVSTPHIRNLERNRCVNPGADVLVRLAFVLELDPNELVKFSRHEPTQDEMSSMFNYWVSTWPVARRMQLQSLLLAATEIREPTVVAS